MNAENYDFQIAMKQNVREKIEIKDYFLILNLHKALLEAKFHINPDNIEVAFSPVIANLCNELVDALTKIDEEKDNKNIGRWQNWRKLENKQFYRERAMKNAMLCDEWNTMEDDKKIKIAKNLLSPFIATEKELEVFVEDINLAFLEKDK